ncbi:hypothetical protein KZ829_36245 [Actinoplanes hulinensis]|uniref:Thioredoxin domain-containing protein n=1 Tax=Actinoplanes hulinensis TaxID=1144547 RepID=A0ABS7BE98_9ACTN|nr:hypothetical protein [Actinoplanes hulinensis]MBW6439191.1 hypothetical protein [Actinoplanes hulinensis]
MNAVILAMLIMSWVAIALLVLGYAGLVAQIKDLQSRAVPAAPTTVFPELAATGPGAYTVALTLSSTCGTCDEAFEIWPQLASELVAGGHRPVLISIDNSPVWTERGAENLLLASDLSAPLLLSYQPALVRFDSTGALFSADPLGSAAGLREAVHELLAPSVPSAR